MTQSEQETTDESGVETDQGYEIYRCSADGSNDWYLAVSDDDTDYLVSPQGNLHDSPQEETYSWLTDPDWTCSDVPIGTTPFGRWSL